MHPVPKSLSVRKSAHASRIRTMLRRKQALIFLMIFFVVTPTAYAFKGLLLSPHAKRLADDVIEKLVEISKKSGGTKQIGKELDELQFPDEVLEDAFLRIAFARQIVTRAEAVDMFSKLSGVKGFRTILRKVIGSSEEVTKGHLYELRIATRAHDEGFAVREIGRPFRDGTKRWTDIDVVMEKNGKFFVVEAKDYGAKTPLNMDAIRGDMDTLTEYLAHTKEAPVFPVCCVFNVPENARTLTRLIREAKRRNIELVFGNARAQAIQFRQLEEIL